MPKRIIILCSRCGAKRRKMDFKKKPNGELYKLCNICRDKLAIKKSEHHTSEQQDSAQECNTVVSQTDVQKNVVQPTSTELNTEQPVIDIITENKQLEHQPDLPNPELSKPLDGPKQLEHQPDLPKQEKEKSEEQVPPEDELKFDEVVPEYNKPPSPQYNLFAPIQRFQSKISPLVPIRIQ